MMEQFARRDQAPSPPGRRTERSTEHERARRLVEVDPEIAARLADRPDPGSQLRLDALDRLDHLFEPRAADAAPLDFSQGPSLQVLVPPYHYSGKDPHGNARMFPDHAAGTIGLGATAGNVEGSDDDRQEGVCWIGVGLYSSQTIQVRVAPMVIWKSLWTLSVAGIVFVTSSPWADWQASYQVQAYDGNGPVTALQSELLVHRRLRDAPGARWVHDDSYETGNGPTLHTYLTIPGGQTRWFNVLAHGVAEVDYSFENSAAAQCGMDLNINLIVVERV
jgi:hypothetical protein